MARLITDADIKRIWREYVKVNDTPDYLNRYVPLPLERQTDAWPWAGKDFPRVVCVLEFERLVWIHAVRYYRLLVVNGGQYDPEAGRIESRYRLNVDYDGTNDLHALDLPEKDFDLILLGHTLEHLVNPIQALERLRLHLAPGGCLFASVPVVTIPHSTPAHHYMGFTPTGLGCMCLAAGFEVASIGHWGNMRYIELLNTTRRWPDYLALGDQIGNDFNRPCGAWVLARRAE